MNVFIIGNTEADSEVVAQNYRSAEIDLSDYGYTPISPIRFMSNIRGLTQEQEIDIGYALLEMCQAVYLIGAWNGSAIQNQYVGYARAKGMEFFYPENLIINRQKEEVDE